MSAALVAALAAPSAALACTQVWMPDAYTDQEGTWYYGRAEDSFPRAVKIFGVEPAHKAGFTYQSEENDFAWTSPSDTYRYTYVRDHGDNDWNGRTDAYTAAGINENGVSCSATLSLYMNPRISGEDGIDPVVENNGIGEYNYASIVLGQSATAKQGVELLGQLVDKYGTMSTDQIVVSDANQSWLFMTLSGHQWVAVQLPENAASLNPNMGSLTVDINLDDPEVLHSAGVYTLLQQADKKVTAEADKFVKHDQNGNFDVVASYANIGQEGPGQYSRYAIGRQYFGAPVSIAAMTVDNGRVTMISDAPLYFVPGRDDYTTFDMIRSLGARGAGTELDANKNPGLTGVGRQDSLESHVFEIERGEEPDVATVEWLALNRDEFSVAVPTFSALITRVSPRYGTQALDLSHQGEEYWEDDVDKALEAGDWDEYLPYVMMDLNTLAFNNRDNVAEGLRDYLDAVQNALVADNETVKEALVSKEGNNRTAFANKAARLAAEKTWERCNQVLKEVREYLAGSQQEPFAASDLAEDGTLKEAFTYAADTLKPSTYSWNHNADGWWLEDEDGGYPVDDWMKLDGKWYLFGPDGFMLSGWQKHEGDWYYLGAADDGAMRTGWQKIGSSWYFFNSGGVMKTGWQKDGAKWYYLGGPDDGAMKTGWQKIGDQWYFLNADGVMKTGWHKDGDCWYYLDTTGAMKTGWQKIGDTWYYFNASGAMAADTRVDGYYLNYLGAWVPGL